MDDTYTGNTHILQTQLEKYVRQGLYPLHMPGHKRLVQPAPGLPSSWDLTEVEGTDDLHDAGGILSDAMRRTARLWGAERTWYLVNGSTCGLLAAIRALAGHGAEVICARNCHKAVFHAIELSGYRVRWLMPAVNEEWGICGGISALQVQAALSRYPAAKAVILTSPTYEGILSDIKGICRVCHEKGIPVLVDEAHGAHLMPLSAASGFPAGALAGGADLVVQSPHKTLPSLTQTALLHLQGRIADPARVEEELDIFETSSPSYPLMASLDGCTGILREQGEELFQRWADRIGRFDVTVRSRLHRIRILGHTDYSSAYGVCDPGKILIDAGPVGMDGRKIAGILREKYRMETEMTRGSLVLAMTSICDEEEALDRLALALEEIEKKHNEWAEKTYGSVEAYHQHLIDDLCQHGDGLIPDDLKSDWRETVTKNYDQFAVKEVLHCLEKLKDGDDVFPELKEYIDSFNHSGAVAWWIFSCIGHYGGEHGKRLYKYLTSRDYQE